MKLLLALNRIECNSRLINSGLRLTTLHSKIYDVLRSGRKHSIRTSACRAGELDHTEGLRAGISGASIPTRPPTMKTKIIGTADDAC